MLFLPFLKGLIVGFIIAVPVGPIGMLCIRRSLLQGRLVGFISGLGAATADAFYGGIAAFGITAISTFLLAQQRPLEIVGGGALIIIGVHFLFLKHKKIDLQVKGSTALFPAYTSTLALTLTNPTTIISFGAVFAGMGLGTIALGSPLRGVALVLGVFLGSSAWWLVLSEGVHHLRGKVSSQSLRWTNAITGALLAAFGIAAFVKGVI